MARILIIDDDEHVRLTLSEVIESLGHQTRTAADGKSGLELFAREAFDLVLTDLGMPGIDGLTVLRRVKRKRPGMGVLVITGNSGVDLLAAAVNMGVDAYVTKPFKLAELEEQIARTLARTQADGRKQRPVGPIRGALLARVPIWALLAAAAIAILIRVAG